ncbi:MAG: magnesium and cobalt transport protein CorA, partial [Nitrospinae bacterium CG11_big_fil_rev_8_21_14_0_20_56_8]
DIVNVHQRPKIEEYDNYLFITTRLAQLKNGDLDLEQIGLILGRGFILSFEERATGCLDPVRDRIRKPLSNRVRLSSPDYLVYAMLDTIVDAIFPVLEKYSDQLDRLEEDVLSNPAPSLVNQIHRLKHDLILLIRLFWQQRESLNQLVKENEKFSNDTRVFLRDCHDHIFQIIDILETFRERASGLTDIYLSSLSNRMNEIIKVLTMIATIFMPLGFVAGLYGMNFDRGASPLNMPELGWYFGYPFALGLMVAIALGLILFFRRKGWLGDSLARNSRQDSVSAEA